MLKDKIPADLNLETCFAANKLTNVSKTDWVLFSSAPLRTKFSGLVYNLQGASIRREESFKYLGITLDFKLNLEYHVFLTVKKCNAKLHFLQKLHTLVDAAITP